MLLGMLGNGVPATVTDTGLEWKNVSFYDSLQIQSQMQFGV